MADFKLPELGEDIEEADVLKVLVAEGDTVTADQPLIEIETEKATLEVPSEIAGTITKLHVKQGDTIKVGQLIVTIEEGGAAKPAKAEPEAKAAPAKEAAAEVTPLEAVHEFVTVNRDTIIERCRARIATRSAPRATPVELEYGVPFFLEQLVETLRLAVKRDGNAAHSAAIASTATLHGSELHRGGFTIAQVVRDYGGICQVITELAVERGAPIGAREFQTLNLCLDDAIAGAVTEYGRLREIADTERLGRFAHELRNFLNSALLAFEVLKSGSVGVGGSTGLVLERSLAGLRNLVDREISEVRLGAGTLHRETVQVRDLLEDVEVAAAMDAANRGVEFSVAVVPPDIAVRADRQILESVLANLLQNAFKFTRAGGHVALRAEATAHRVRIAVEDECGGLPAGRAEELFLPFVSAGATPTPYPGALNFPYGPFYLPTGLFGPPYTGAMQSLGLFSTVSMLDGARAAGLHLIVNLSGNRVSFQKPDGSFDLLAWEALVAKFAGVIEPYIADGTIVGHLMFDEPQDGSNWNGLPVPCADIEAAAVYSKLLWPGMQTGAGTHATWIAAQPCNWNAFDFTLTPYKSKRGTAADFMNDNIAAAQSVGLKYYASINVEIGGAGGAEVSAAELQSWGSTFIGNPNVCGLTFWQYSDAYFTRSDIVPVLTDLGAQAAARGPCP